MTSPTTAPITPTQAAPMTAHRPGSGRPPSRAAIVFTAYSPRPRQTWRGSGCRSAGTRHPRFPGPYDQSSGALGPDPALIPLCLNRPRPASGLTRNPDTTATSRLDRPPMPTPTSPHTRVRPAFQRVNDVPVTEPPQGICHGHRTCRASRSHGVPSDPPDEVPGDRRPRSSLSAAPERFIWKDSTFVPHRLFAPDLRLLARPKRRSCALSGSLRAVLLDNASDAGSATAREMTSRQASIARVPTISLSVLEPISNWSQLVLLRDRNDGNKGGDR
jgi:hypothetical protein